MEIIILLICISLSIAIGFLGLFLWNIKSGQYDDTDTPAFRILFENKEKKATTKQIPQSNPDKTQVRG